jgi:hypothetical protein
MDLPLVYAFPVNHITLVIILNVKLATIRTNHEI